MKLIVFSVLIALVLAGGAYASSGECPHTPNPAVSIYNPCFFTQPVTGALAGEERTIVCVKREAVSNRREDTPLSGARIVIEGYNSEKEVIYRLVDALGKDGTRTFTPPQAGEYLVNVANLYITRIEVGENPDAPAPVASPTGGAVTPAPQEEEEEPEEEELEECPEEEVGLLGAVINGTQSEASRQEVHGFVLMLVSFLIS
jgi:hypothetical protein